MLNGRRLESYNLIITDLLSLTNSTIHYPGKICNITCNGAFLNEFSTIRYDEVLWLNASKSLDISGAIYPKILDYEGEKTKPSVFILAGITSHEVNEQSALKDNLLDFVFWDSSIVIGYYIQVFSDKSLSIYGDFNNYYRDREDNWRVVQS